MRNRNSILGALPKNSVGCEIGVWKGEFAEQLVTVLNPKKLYLVDPWLYMPAYPDRWYGGSSAKGQEDMDKIESDVRFKFRKIEEIEVVKGTFDDLIAQKQGNLNLDWVYVDGNHSYEYVLSDLENGLVHTVNGGVLAGDDFDAPEVRQAVIDFASKYKLECQSVDQTQYAIKVRK